MSSNDIDETFRNVSPEYTKIVTVAIDKLLHEYTAEERMFFAMQYARSRYAMIDEPENDVMDYRIAVDRADTAVTSSNEDTNA